MPLPPLPPISTWSTYFPRRLLALSTTEPAKVLRGRTILANQKLTDEFVRHLGIREGEVVVEVNPGMGALTRSLLNGGRSGDVKEEWRAWEEGRGVTEGKKEKGKGKAKAKEGDEWPGWSNYSRSSSDNTSSDTPSGPSEDALRKPALVIVSEPSPQLLSRAFDYTPKPPASNFPASISLDYQSENLNLQICPHEPSLILSESTAYRWPTLPGILSDPAVVSHINKSSEDTQGSGEARKDGKRRWEDPEPPITIVAHIPDSVIGEQMLAQWIGSVVGGSQGRQWIWQWGRVRLAVLCAKGLYNRIMARPRETINCKLSILTSALFHRSPLPPYHHVPNVDKSSRRTTASPISGYITPTGTPKRACSPSVSRPKKSRAAAKTDQTEDLGAIIDPTEPDFTAHQPSITYSADFFPPSGTASAAAEPLDRPALLGILLTPRLESPVMPHQKEAWDYVLRNTFIREIQPIEEATKNLGFGAENLIPKYQAPNDEGWRGDRVEPGTRVKDMTVGQWARVVDVFERWPFRPQNLLLEDAKAVESSRELGVD